MPQSAVDIYDVTTGVWTASVYKLSAARYFLAAVGSLDKIFIAGGSNGSAVFSLLDVYDTTLDLWFSSLTGSGSLALPRFRLTAATTQNYVLFAGGVYAYLRVTCTVLLTLAQWAHGAKKPYSAELCGRFAVLMSRIAASNACSLFQWPLDYTVRALL